MRAGVPGIPAVPVLLAHCAPLRQHATRAHTCRQVQCAQFEEGERWIDVLRTYIHMGELHGGLVGRSAVVVGRDGLLWEITTYRTFWKIV